MMSFDLLAPHYRWMEWLLAGGKLQRCRTAFLDTIPAPASVLIFGEGNGRFLARLCQQFPAAHVTCIDSSAEMIRRARLRLARHGLQNANVQFIHADALDWHPPEAAFDLVVTHFFLDCFREDQLGMLIPMIAGAAKRHATWLVGDFKVAGGGFWRLRSEVVLAVMYLFFRGVTGLSARRLTAPDAMLREAGFRCERRLEFDRGLLHSDVWLRQG